MSIAEADLLPLFRRELEMCRLGPGEVVGIYSEGGVRDDYARAFARAAAGLGAGSFHIDLPAATGKALRSGIGGRADGRGLSSVPAAVTAFKEADLMVDLMLILFEPELEEIKHAGTRVISCVEPPEVLMRMFPTEDQRRRSEEALASMRAASTAHVTSAAGTDVVYEFGELVPFCQYGYSDEAGRWDQFPSTFVVHCPNPDGTNGRVVLGPGDIIWPFGRFIDDVIDIRVEDGYVTSIEGGSDALLLRDAIRRGDDRRASAISHIGWGVNEHARWDSVISNPHVIGMENRSYAGAVMFATGPNTEFGGINGTPCHFDIPMRNCSLYLDDALIIDAGRIVSSTDSSIVRMGEPPAGHIR